MIYSIVSAGSSRRSFRRYLPNESPMKLQTFPADSLQLLRQFHGANGAIDYICLAVESSDHGDSKAIHQAAAIFGIGKLPESQGASAPYSEPPSLRRKNFNGTKIEPASKFRGPDTSSSGLPEGYLTAFIETPYNINLEKTEAIELFDQINLSLFGGIDDELEVYDWSGDWTDYFDAGNEWWGAFLWTVRRPSSERIVWIGASTTD